MCRTLLSCAAAQEMKKKSTSGLATSLCEKGENEHVGVKKSMKTVFRELLSSCQFWKVNVVA
jgi:hypothetical protein